MLKKQIWQAAIFSSVILVAVMAIDYLFTGILFSEGEPYSGWITASITLLVIEGVVRMAKVKLRRDSP